MAESTLMKWQSRVLMPGLTVDVLADAPLDVVGGPSAGSVVAGDQPVRVGIFWGAGQDLALWRGNMGQVQGTTFASETVGTVCGRPARRIEATVPGHSAHYTGPAGSATSTTPTEVMVFYAFQAGGVPVVAFYVAPAAERERYLADELHFLTSIKCTT